MAVLIGELIGKRVSYLTVFLGMPALILGSAAVQAWLSSEPVKFVSRVGNWPSTVY
jgi:hypothetical protein